MYKHLKETRMSRPEQIVQPLKNTLLRPADSVAPSQIFVVTVKQDGKKVITPYFSVENLSFETIKIMRSDLGLPPIASQAQLDAELEMLIGVTQP